MTQVCLFVAVALALFLLVTSILVGFVIKPWKIIKDAIEVAAPRRPMRCVVLTPAGRREYLELLFVHLSRQRLDFAMFIEWHLWLNTLVPEDVAYMRELERQHSWIKVITDPESDPTAGSFNIHRFFKHATDRHTVYIRLDDDVVYLEPGFLQKLYKARVSCNPDYFLVYANIINNAVITHAHQRGGAFMYPTKVEPTCMGNAWSDPAISEQLHRQFLSDVRAGNLQRWHQSFDPFETTERVSINAFAFFGSVFQNIHVGIDEEDWLSVVHLRESGKRNLVIPGAICAHYAFYTQRPHLNTTDILEQYRRLV
jgi:hypothetical protein